MLGTPDWEADWYRAPAQDDLFGDRGSMVERVADVDAIESYVGNRLRTVFPKVLPPLRLRNRANVPSFSLFFAISNPKGEAIGLATRIANHILGTRRSSVMRRK